MDYLTFLGSPIGIILEVCIMGGVAVWLVFGGSLGSKKERWVILDRLKPSTPEAGGQATLYVVSKAKNKLNQEDQIKLPDGKKMTVPADYQQFLETLTIRKKLTLKPGTYRMAAKEAGNIVKLSPSFADTSKIMFDNLHLTQIINRSSLAALARYAASALGDNWLYIVLALMGGLGMGYIIEPYFNHTPPIIEYCTRLINGTVVPRGTCPQL